MKRKYIKLITLASTSVLMAAGIAPVVINNVPTIVSAQEQLPTRKVSLGATLDQTGIERTLQLLNATDVPQADRLTVDGVTIDHYLNDGSNAATGVYSSAIIEPRQPGYGVQIQIVTPQTILNVSPQTYQNAAITSGAKDVLIKIASAYPVTGEGALAGVYAIYEANGNTLNQQNIQVAQKEITLPSEIKDKAQLTDAQINELLNNIKAAITAHLEEHGEISDDTLMAIINEQSQLIADKYNVVISDEVKTTIFNVMKDYAALELDRIQDSIEDSNQESWTTEQAIDLFEGSMSNALTLSQTSIPADYDRTLWEEVSREGTVTVLKYGDLYYRFDKQEYETFITIGDVPSYEDGQLYIVDYTINNYSRLIVRQHNPGQIPTDETGNPVVLDADNVVGYAAAVLFPGYETLDAYLSADEEGNFDIIFTALDEANETIYLGSFKAYPNGVIDHLENMSVSGYDVRIPNIPIEGAYFDQAKNDQLATFMGEWGQIMGQTYQAYWPGNEGDMYGVPFPSDVIKLLSVNDQTVNAYWSEDGSSDYQEDVAIVAAYSDYEHFFATNDDPAGAHYYLFAIIDGSPVVLHSQQNQGQEDGLIHFYPSENYLLQDSFAKIVAGEELESLLPPEEETTVEETTVEETTAEETTAAPETSETTETTAAPETTEPPVEETSPETTEPPVEETSPETTEPPVEETSPETTEPPVEETSPETTEPPVEETSPETTEPPVEETTPVEDSTTAEPEELGITFSDEQELKLDEFVGAWEERMGQVYESFTPEAPSEMYGVAFPSDVINLLAVNGQPANATWLSEDNYQPTTDECVVVASYHNAENFFETNPDTPNGAIFYLFTIQNGEPVVLVSQQSQGAEDGLVHFNPTENTALQEGFKQIIETGDYDPAIIDTMQQ